MKTINNKYINGILALVLLFSTTSCLDFLEEKVYTQYDPDSFLKDPSGVDALLTGAYNRSRIIAYDHRNYTYLLNEFCTDVSFETGGGLERVAAPFIQFNWPINNNILNGQWNKMYSAIASANTVLIVANGLTDLPETELNAIKGEARFIRASAYYYLYNMFGPTPIIEIPEGASPDEIEEIGQSTPRATKEEFFDYVISDLTFASENLPTEETLIGRATKGAALGYLMKFYLNDKNWELAASTAQQIMDLNYYSLYDDYEKLFSVDGEANREYIFRAPCLPQGGYQNNYMAHAFPPGYPVLSSWANYGAQFRTYTAFYKTFEEQDLRRNLFVTAYTNTSGNMVELVEDENGNPLDNVRSFKYWPDPDGVGESHGNDIVYIRYADVLLSRAESLNELNGPNTESIDLINEVRRRANVSEISLADYPSTEALRDFILEERGREFYSEGLRREDLIRHGKFISGAVSRGYNAEAHQVLYPIPLQQIDTNPNLEQNPGY
ncbi:RagB/SusD family nutrient uptake outer membrane protein [Echinicola salinicaeni]|uniref:RagB/SusD family nutrient uptake outer membrane protein n=1 Tax=Echinicola salinicaeni TaxID=2762757 RepID=UPI001645F225|nr:RagB/SusD family nutrient uptake outer membrane protein [Echinicola salinicaeni]